MKDVAALGALLALVVRRLRRQRQAGDEHRLVR